MSVNSMKKNWLIFSFFVAFLLFVLNFASAYYLPSVRESGYLIIQSVTDFFEPILNILFGYNAGGFLFEALLIFILLVSLIYVLLKNVTFISDNPTVRWIVALVIPLIGVRFIDYSWLYGIILQYKFFNIILLSLLPFVLYFFFVYGIAEDHDIFRRILWALFVIVYFGLWTSGENEAASNIFFWTMAGGVIMILFDGVIWSRYRIMQEKKKQGFDKARTIYLYQQEIDKIHQTLANSSSDSVRREGYRRIKDLQKKIDMVRDG